MKRRVLRLVADEAPGGPRPGDERMAVAERAGPGVCRQPVVHPAVTP